MSNSSLVDYTRLSPNNGGKRQNSISIITPHCVVGQCTVETLGQIFAPFSRGASSNYGIGYDGRIGMYVTEDSHSWCTSSWWNDDRAVTIEVASDTTDPYAMRDAAYQSLIKLCVDICKRNNKTKMIWLANKTQTINYKPAKNEMLFSAHRWFANKSCPGDWLYNKLNDLTAKVNAQLGGCTVRYCVHQQNYGWLPWVNEGECAGFTGRSKRIESIKIESAEAEFQYMVHQQTYGDSKWFNEGEEAGVTGQSKRLEGVAIKCNVPIRYKVHVQGTGWTDWVTNGQYCGTKGESKRIEAIKIEFI